jgi:hypothetical protein
MLYPSSAKWAEWGIADECHQFFCLHWTELFDLRTPDTWQVRACNIKSILRELIEAAHIADDGFDAYRGVMRSILDEAFTVVKRDAILDAFYPFVLGYLEPWRSQDIGEKAVTEIERLAIVILGNLDNYWENGVKMLQGMLQAADKKAKKELYATTMNVAVETVARGHTPNHLRETFTKTVLVPQGKPFLERVADGFAAFAMPAKKYKCVFLTEGIKRRYTTGLPPDIKLALGKPEQMSAGAEVEFYQAAMEFSVSLSVEVLAADPRAARQAAEKRLGEVYAGLNLFNIDDRFGSSLTNALVEDEAGAKTIVGHRRLGSEYLGTYNSRLVKADLLFRVQDRLKGRSPSDASQLAAAVEYHRLALQATSDEARLVNLWIALEALCQNGEGSIIERVWRRISPCVSIENVRKNLTSLSIYVKGLWTNANTAEFLNHFPNSTETRLEPGDLAAILLLPDGHQDLKKLFALCLHHPLITHRLFRVKTMIIDKAGSVRANLEYTCQNVEWQIKRIYRARNAIVHTGSAPTQLPQLTQHLHCYLIKAIQTVLIDLDRQPTWTIRDSLEHRLRLFNYLVQFFQKTPEHEIAALTITSPEACMTVQQAPFAWPALAPLQAPAPAAAAEPPAAAAQIAAPPPADLPSPAPPGH